MSFLLLGDGTHLSLSELWSRRGFKFRNVKLLTLSACNTAMGSRLVGAEVESFGALAQKRGAAAVLATLWPVDDSSTGELMQTLYRLRSEYLDMTKAETLRQAQLALLHRDTLKTGRIPARRGPVTLYQVHRIESEDDADDRRHPYYWAPFILMGNWL